MTTKRETDASEAAPRQTARRPKLLRVRVHEAELARWRASAGQHGVHNLSRWLRAVADQAVACGEDPVGWRRDLAALLRSVNAVGNNINQIARTPACGGRPADAAMLEQSAEAVTALSREIRSHLLAQAPRAARGGRMRAGAGGRP
jgi:hypothetical protein